MSDYRIGELARITGANIETIRFYEKEGLLPEPQRTSRGFRKYTPEDARRLGFIQRAKNLGFTLKEIRELLELRVDARTTCADVKMRAENKLADVEQKIRELQQIKDALHTLVSQCSGKGPAGDCPILEALESGRKDDTSAK